MARQHGFKKCDPLYEAKEKTVCRPCHVSMFEARWCHSSCQMLNPIIPTRSHMSNSSLSSMTFPPQLMFLIFVDEYLFTIILCLMEKLADFKDSRYNIYVFTENTEVVQRGTAMKISYFIWDDLIMCRLAFERNLHHSTAHTKKDKWICKEKKRLNIYVIITRKLQKLP